MRLTTPVIYNGRTVELAMGFDNHNQGYFMTVAPTDDDVDNPDADEESGMIYSNLDDKALKFPAVTEDLSHYKKVLRDMNIDVAPEFFGKVLAACD